MALEERLRGRVRFEYYGLPKPLTDDPIVREEGITGVPTVLVSVDGEEIGRLQGRALDRPGEALAGLFGAWR